MTAAKQRDVYARSFYEERHARTKASAEAIIGILHRHIRPASVLDLGCGVGTFLSVFKTLGARDVLGMDGPWVQRDLLEVPAECFKEYDLTKPVELGRRFDLAMSLEVAEHLPQECAETFVESLTRHSDIVLFGAAVPHQGGTSHVNEQWQSDWSALFEKRGYVTIDAVRRHVWSDPSVQWYYAQNALLFVKESQLAALPSLEQERAQTAKGQLNIVHPELLEYRVRLGGKPVPGLTFRLAVRRLPGLFWAAVKHRMPGGSKRRGQP